MAGFTPATDTESTRLGALEREISLDATREPHRLTSKNDHEPRDAKRVLRVLTGGDAERRDACLEIPLEQLRTRAAKCGLPEFLDDVAKWPEQLGWIPRTKT